LKLAPQVGATATHDELPPEPGFARREAYCGVLGAAAKKGVHGGNMVSPVLDQGDVRPADRLPVSVHGSGRHSLNRVALVAALAFLAVASGASAATIRGTKRADRIQAVNGVRDRISCGRGSDV